MHRQGIGRPRVSDPAIPPTPRSLGNRIHTIAAPLPYRKPPWVNCYVIETNDGLVLIDCGADWEKGWGALLDGLHHLGFDDRPVTDLIVSHLHPDHVGMAPRVVAHWECRFVMHRVALKTIPTYNDTEATEAWMREFAANHGVPADLVPIVGSMGPRPDFMPLLSEPDRVVDEGDVIDLGGARGLEVLYTPGHDPAHICLRDTDTAILFSGDHVLPRISPVVMYSDIFPDVLSDYMNSLQLVKDLSIGLTYPAHGEIVAQGDLRAHQILLHHERRLREMVQRVERIDVTAWNLVLDLFRPNLAPQDQRLALLETVAHLDHLALKEEISEIDHDGVAWYTSRR
ncbi:MAG: MBL fold metallo-hydrolase [Acidimicrobiia bacterium]|nr:MBL fold metallo-hydrolase [Acidimicrobiia bacterium]